MLDAPKEKVKKIMEEKNWTESVSTAECLRLMRKHRDVLEEEIKFLDRSGYIVTEKRFPRWCLNKYHLYQFLKKHGRVSRCEHAEKVLKKSATKGK